MKICGITCVQDALIAARAGADAIGMVFHPAAGRFIDDRTARAILDALPPFVSAVGLFVDQPAEKVVEKARALGLRHVQLHGEESSDVVAAVAPFSVIKAIRVERMQLEARLRMWKSATETLRLGNLGAILLDTGGTGHAGGTGIENDWETISASRRNGAFAGLPPIIAAGGLRPGNVARVVREIQPRAVDVSSGVEASPGRKSQELIEAFIRAATSTGDNASQSV